MGGSALKNTKTVRADDGLYLDVYRHVEAKLSREFPNLVHYLPRTVREKSDHGDLDLLVRRDTAPVERETVNRLFSPNELVVNDNVWSFDVFNFQVDLIVKRKEYWKTLKTFYDFGGLGNLMGKVARWLRYKWGFQGLRMPVYRDPQGERSLKYGEYVLTRDPREAFEFLSFDYDRFQEGFQDMTEIFEYVRSSEHFCKEPFMPENLTADQKQRDRKRPVWDQFKRHLEKLGELPSKPDSRPTQEEAMKRAKEAFPFSELHHELEQDKEFVELREEAKNTWTGRVPMEEFGVEGSDLGEMLGNFHDTFNTEKERYEWLVRNSREEALERFKWANSEHFDNVDGEKARGDEQENFSKKKYYMKA